MLKDLLFALDLGLRVIGSFILCTYVGLKLDDMFHSHPLCVLLGIILAFVYVMKLLLGVGKHE